MSSSIETLRAALDDWTDWDVAGYSMAVALGLIDPERSPFPTKAKHVFWTDNAVGNALHQFLETLVSPISRRKRDPALKRPGCARAGDPRTGAVKHPALTLLL